MVLFHLYGLAAFAQDARDPDIFMELNLRYGKVLHHPNRDFLEDLYFNSYEFRFGLQSSGENNWEKPLNYPITGIALRFTNYTDYSDSDELQQRQKDIMGSNLALFGYLQAPIIRFHRFNWHFQLGMGFGVFSKIYDEITNPENVLISTRVTPYINFQTGFDIQLNDRLDLTLNANYTHASNASWKFPNYGINEVQGLAGIRYHIHPGLSTFVPMEKSEFKPSGSMFVAVEPGWMWSRYNNYYYFKTGTSFGYERQLHPVFRVGGAVEAHYIHSLGPSPEFRIEDEYSIPDVLTTGSLYAFGELCFGRFAFHVGFGTYVFRSPKNIELAKSGARGGSLYTIPAFFERSGFRIDLGEKRTHFVGAILRAHYPVADYLAFVYGYKFKHK